MNINSYNQFIGFTINFQNKLMSFKLKNLKEKRNKGARCDQSGKAKAIKNLMRVLNINEPYEILKNNSQIEVCIKQEIILRYYQMINKNNKIWYLNSEIAYLNDIEKQFQ